ncbi:MAG TPA: hypothetical protein VGB13_04450 [Candidatus Krumholzibacteria bacterium]
MRDTGRDLDRHRWLMESIREGFPEYDQDKWPILSTLEDVRRRLDEAEKTFERLVCFLYILARDEVPAGAIERVLVHHVELGDKSADLVKDCKRSYSSPRLEALAREWAQRIVLSCITAERT